MNEWSISAEELGVVFHPDPGNMLAGFSRLDCCLNPGNNEQVFNPVKLILPVIQTGHKAGEKQIKEITLFHPWPYDDSYLMSCGLIEIQDARGEKIEVLTYGGDISIDCDDVKTCCRLRSPVPFFHYSDIDSVTHLFVEEVKILLAEERARCGEESCLEKNLVHHAPKMLYAASLRSLRKKFRALQEENLPHTEKMITYIQDRIRDMKEADEWPEDTPDFCELL